MRSSRWQAAAAGAVLMAALAWGLWPRRVAEPSDAGAPVPVPGVAGVALREAVQQSGAPGSTPALAQPATAADGIVEARVLAQGRPRAGAHVRLYLRGRADPNTAQIDWRFAGAADTGPDGIARIPARPGRYLLAARSETFAPARVELRRPAGERATQVTVELKPGVTVSGRTVQKGTQQPAPLALVILTVETSRDPDAPAEEQARTTSDLSGRFRLDGIEPGRYRATAQAPGFARGTARIDASASKVVSIELPPFAAVEGRVPGAAATLAGAVVAAGSGKPVAGAQVAVSPHDADGDLGRAVSDGSGAFRVLGLAPGSYDVEVSADGFSDESRRGVTVPAGQQFALRIELRRTGAVEGVVRDAAGRGVPYPVVRVFSGGEARGDGSGAYRLSGIAPGPGFVTALRDGSAAGATAAVEVPEAGTARLDFQLADEGVVTGRVRRADGTPPPADAMVTAISTSSPAAAAFIPVDASGTYVASLPAGGYLLGLSGGSSRARAPITVEAGRTVTHDLTWTDAAQSLPVTRAQ